MRDENVAPDPQLMESMRAVGYTLETAIADIIDNSITAGADQIDVRFIAKPESRIAVIDNGSGMDQETLVLAMRLAGRPPSVDRKPDDLGRFGLGLKTASLSQARSVTVATKQDDVLRAVRWDLDHLKETGKWALQILNKAEACSLPWVESLNVHETGTLVLWENLDQLHLSFGSAEKELDEHMHRASDHLKLVFHRFTSAKMPPLRRPLTLRLNGARLPRVDPFLTDNPATQWGPHERIQIKNAVVDVQPYTLPHVSKLNPRDRNAALLAGTLRDSQGFYIYRAGRLVLWGTWFRIIPRDELGKLARVQVDIPNSLDDLWALDIKKSLASPPPEIRQRLRQIADRIVRPSRRVHAYKGRIKSAPDKIDRLWNLVEDRDNTFRYEINTNHPLVLLLSESLDGPENTGLAHLLHALESTFPVEDAYARLGSDNSHTPSAIEQAELAELVKAFRRSIGGGSAQALARQLALMEPFNHILDLESFIKEAIDE
jgi:hypothetical protein